MNERDNAHDSPRGRDKVLDLFLILLVVAGACAVLGVADQIDQLMITGVMP